MNVRATRNIKYSLFDVHCFYFLADPFTLFSAPSLGKVVTSIFEVSHQFPRCPKLRARFHRVLCPNAITPAPNKASPTPM